MDTNFIISLDSIADVNAFANTIAHFKSEIDLSSGRYARTQELQGSG